MEGSFLADRDLVYGTKEFACEERQKNSLIYKACRKKN